LRLRVDNSENSDESISETSVEVLLVLGPGEGSATDWCVLSLMVIESGGLISVDESLVWEIVDSDSVLGTNNEPVELGGEEDNVNWRLGVDLLKMSSLNKVPDMDLTVSSSGSDEVGVWCQVESVDLSLVSNEGVLEGHHRVIPDLDGLIPGGGDNNWGLGVVVVSNARNPVGVRVLVNSELADSMDVPNLEGLINGSRGDLSVIWGESNGKDILGVTEESLSGGGSLEVPESDGSVPGGGKAESRVLRKIDV